MAEGGRARRVAPWAALAAVVAVPLLLALTDFHLEGAPAALVLSTAAGALAVSALVLQPLLAGRGRIGPHRMLGGVALVLVLAHVAGLFAVAPDDALFAMSPDGPTRARMALIATIALVAVVVLGVGHGRLPIGAASWRILHAFLAVLRDRARHRPRGAHRRRARRGSGRRCCSVSASSRSSRSPRRTSRARAAAQAEPVVPPIDSCWPEHGAPTYGVPIDIELDRQEERPNGRRIHRRGTDRRQHGQAACRRRPSRQAVVRPR